MVFSRLPLQLLRHSSHPSLRVGSLAPAVRLPAGARSIAQSPTLSVVAAAAAAATRTAATDRPPRFADFDLHPALLKQIKHPSCSDIQALSLPVSLKGQDILAQAKTGTGKTAAFLIPTLDAQLRNAVPRQRGHVSCLIVSPTRELASQIAAEAKTLAPTGTRIVTCFGATNVKTDVRALSDGCDILVGTPGRLNDLIANYGLKSKLQGVRHFILDEGDQLLDAGFKPEVEKICRALPSRAIQPRQTLLFSATVPSRLTSVVSLALLPGYAHLSSITPGEENTHVHVPQQATVVEWPDIYGAALGVISEEMQRDPDGYKVIVFAPTARAAAVLYEAINAGFDVGPAFQIHSRMSQPAREKASAAFKACKSGVLFSSDVVARGLDYPSISLVLQVGAPSSPEQYIHRLGRTARAGKEGRGAIVLSPDERSFLEKKKISSLRIEEVGPFSNVKELSTAVAKAMGNVDARIREKAAAAHLGYYNGVVKDKARVVALSAEYAVRTLGLAKFPALPARTINMMGLQNRGLEVGPPASGR